MYALRTRAPVPIAGPLDLHVLGLPLAFILSQDQTLHRIIFILLLTVARKCRLRSYDGIKFRSFNALIIRLKRKDLHPLPSQSLRLLYSLALR
jgi:hypothetical protein